MDQPNNKRTRSTEEALQFLDPSNIQTTILAEIFQESQESYERRKLLEESSEFTSRVHRLMRRLHPLKTFSLLIIFLSFYLERPDWCRIALSKGDKGIFYSTDTTCSVDNRGYKYYTFNLGYSWTEATIPILTWICMLFICHEELLILFLKCK